MEMRRIGILNRCASEKQRVNAFEVFCGQELLNRSYLQTQ
jgi:hypothetical protein